MAWLALAVAAAGCGEPTLEAAGTGGNGDSPGGTGSGKQGRPDGGFSITFADARAFPTTGPGNDEACATLIARIRDFKSSHPDFEKYNNGISPKGLVSATLDAEDKPQLSPTAPRGSITSAETFRQWYRDVPGVNVAFDHPIPLTRKGPDTYVFEDYTFFPLDGRGLEEITLDGGVKHNFHFTTEIRGLFRYRGGELFTFKGDDDLWVFVNKRLALDLGGVHGVLSGTIDFDRQAAELGIEPGRTYDLRVFHAERHTKSSNFRIETSIACFQDVP